MPLSEPLNPAADPSEEQFNSWLSPAQAFGHLLGGLYPELHQRLLNRLLDGKLLAAAGEARWREDGLPALRRCITIQPDWWDGSQTFHHINDPLWTVGEVTLPIRDDGGFENLRVNFYDVRFDFDGLAGVVPGLTDIYTRIPKLGGGYFLPGTPLHDQVAAREASTQPPTILPVVPDSGGVLYSDLMRDPEVDQLKARIAELEARPSGKQKGRGAGGAPPKAFWDDLWVAMFRKYWEGPAPNSIAAIADAMLQWASDQGHDLSESSAKRAARKLWPVVRPDVGS